MLQNKHLLFLFSLASSAILVDSLAQTELNAIRTRIRKLIDDDFLLSKLPFRRLIPGFVRLIFHDCVSQKCDACINDASSDNAGLRSYIDLSEPLYQQLRTEYQLSRADYWSIAATEAIYYAAELAPGRPPKPVPTISFQTGRTDCVGSPWTTSIDQFPSAFLGTDQVLEYFNKNFAFDAKETTAVLGAHTLGEAHVNASGFRGPWDAGRDHFNNEFYIHLMDPVSGWQQLNVARPRSTPKYQWQSTSLPPTMMLVSDVALIKDQSPLSSTTGQSPCSFSTCPATTAQTLSWVTAFAQNNLLFLTEFSKAFQKMISKGYSTLNDIVP